MRELSRRDDALLAIAQLEPTATTQQIVHAVASLDAIIEALAATVAPPRCVWCNGMWICPGPCPPMEKGRGQWYLIARSHPSDTDPRIEVYLGVVDGKLAVKVEHEHPEDARAQS